MGAVINFSGWYKVEFLTEEANRLVMKLTVLDRDEYLITLTLKSLTIHMLKNFTNPFQGVSAPEDLHWIAKYMIRPTKWGKRIYDTNPQLITKMWGLVASKPRMKALRGVSPPWQVTVKL